MKLDFATLAFGYELEIGGGTPNWGTALGQGKEHKINDSYEIDEILKGITYSSVSLDKISAKIGKGGKTVLGNEEDSPIVIAGVFSDVFINETPITNSKFVLLIQRDMKGVHSGRLKLKYGLSNSFNDGQNIYSNEDFFEKARNQLGLKEDACWFVTEINIINQNSLRLKAVVINKEEKMTYKNTEALHEEWDKYFQEDYRTNNSFKSDFKRNMIVFGAPGTGKSYQLNKDRKKLLYKDGDFDESAKYDVKKYGKYERVTFHPDYTYANFVGTYKPIPSKDADGKDIITYSYVSGPFIRILVEALRNCREEIRKPYLLIIEEINRANVAAVFGDMFQLLDRSENGESEYSINTSKDLREYLSQPEVLGGSPNDYEIIKIPDNMFIWATMNSADQGVFPMDTAFKRRWDFKYLGIDDYDDEIKNKTVELGSGSLKHKIRWNDLRKKINIFLADQGINEDKQLGPYFISRKIVVPQNGNEIDSEEFIEVFKNKVLMYLFEDAAKSKRPKVFPQREDYHGEYKVSRYSDLCKAFDEYGMVVFHDDIYTHVEEIKDDKESGED